MGEHPIDVGFDILGISNDLILVPVPVFGDFHESFFISKFRNHLSPLRSS